ncbi:MAG: SLBB domain-containing protein [Spirochaetales bacterium]|nr:SLBB domain-containing protein [Spirochaetales bacterium]
MKKLITIAAILILLTIPVFAQDQETSTLDTEITASSIEPGFGLQADIFKYVLTSSDNLQTTNTGDPTNFEVLNNYPLTPGDVFTLLINYGANTERSADYITTYNIQLQQDYTMSFPFVGKKNVRGMSVNKLHTFISKEISEITPVQYISFYLAAPAHFNVFIYGGVNASGYISATPLTTTIDAISLCGGFKPNASYRDVRIERGGEVLSVDISNFYKNADYESNPKLRPGDKLYIPMAEEIVTISGMIKYPGTYEMLPEETLCDLMNFAGGLTPGASEDRIEIARVDTDGKVIKKKTAMIESECTDLFNGDAVSIPSITENSETITIEGAIYGKRMPGTAPFTAPTTSIKLEVPFYAGIDLLNVLDKVGGPTPYAITDKTAIRSKAFIDTVLVDLDSLWKTRDEKYNIELHPGDHILIPVERTVIGVYGAVNVSNSISPVVAYVNGNTVLDYIRLAGGIDYQTADPNNITAVDRYGNRSKIGLDEEPAPGSFIYVEKNILQTSNEFFSNISMILGWVTIGTAVYTVISDFISTFTPTPTP